MIFSYLLTLSSLVTSYYESTRTSKDGGSGGRRYMPYVFSESGIAMLSSVLNSEQAIKVNISIIRTFVKLRQLLASDETLVERINQLEQGTDKLFRVVFKRLDAFEANTPILPAKRKKIGLSKK